MSANAPAPAWQGPTQSKAGGSSAGFSGASGAATAVSAISSAASAYSQASAARAQAEFAESMARINARFSELQAEDAIRRGDKEASKRLRDTKTIIGRQRAALGAQGVNLAEGTPLEVQEETAALGASDALQIRNNAWREAWGYRVQALTGAAQGSVTAMAGRATANATLLTGGLAAARDIAGGIRDYRRYR